jgi:hypothetical protein
MAEEIGLTELRLAEPPRDSKTELNLRARCEVLLKLLQNILMDIASLLFQHR